MAAKTKKSTRRTAQPRAAEFAESVVNSGQKIWLAGLGAFERAKKEGPKMFETLVQRGKVFRGQAADAADQALKNVRAQADATAAQAAGKWDKLEQVFEDRVSRSLNRLGVLSSKDVDTLARQVAEFLRADERVESVNFAGFADSPYFPLVQKYLGGKACSLMTFEVRGGLPAAMRFYNALRLFKRLVNLGDAKSLACHPASTTHRHMTSGEQLAAGVGPGSIRLSVGIEHIDDILADLDQALGARV